MINNLSIKQVADFFGVSEVSIRNWMREDPPMPSTGSGRGLRFDLKDCFMWWRAREFRTYERGIGKHIPAIAESEARDAAATATLREIKVAQAQRILIAIPEAEARLSKFVNQCATQLRAIKNRVRAKYGEEVADFVDGLVMRATQDLANGAQVKRKDR